MNLETISASCGLGEIYSCHRTSGDLPGAGCHGMPYHIGMSRREVIAREVERLPEQDLDKILGFLRSLKYAHSENAAPRLPLNRRLPRTG